MRVTFFWVAKRKSPKKRRPPVCDPFAVRRGKPASGRLRGAPWNSLCCCAAPLGQPRRVRARGMGAPTPMLTPQPPRRRRSQQGWGAKQPSSRTGLCFARPHLAGASATRCAGWAERSAAKQWPVWMSAPRVPFRMRRGAQRPADQGSRLSERSEFERDPAGREHRRLPAAKRRDAACRVAFSLVTFSWRRKRKLLRRRAHTPASALKTGTPSNQRTSPCFDSSARTGGA